jgi:hypothetical protein
VRVTAYIAAVAAVLLRSPAEFNVAVYVWYKEEFYEQGEVATGT